jgi:hypothetical protein
MKDETYIAVVLDRSGSMESVKAETISGFNHFLKEQKEQGANARLTLVQFDSQSTDFLTENQPVRDAQPLTEDIYQPRGMTPLLDALGATINSTGKTLNAIPEANRPDKVVFVIITDGEENASHQFTRAQIKEMIEHQSQVYKWQFVYLGANQDAFAEAGEIGINPAAVANFKVANMEEAFLATSMNVASYRKMGNAAKLAYSDAQRYDLAEDEDRAKQTK